MLTLIESGGAVVLLDPFPGNQGPDGELLHGCHQGRLGVGALHAAVVHFPGQLVTRACPQLINGSLSLQMRRPLVSVPPGLKVHPF